MDDERARPIESVEDVEALLDAGRVSFEECLDAIHVAKPKLPDRPSGGPAGVAAAVRSA